MKGLLAVALFFCGLPFVNGLGCPDGYSYLAHARRCYRAYDRENTYDQALAACQENGSTLAMPRDGTTNDFLVALKNAANAEKHFYIGLDRQDGSWNYVDGGELGYTDWGDGEPNSRGSAADIRESTFIDRPYV
ncbi:C-type lectin lectoxin-Lio3-like [Branchiostoma lanceolatum]|uniref:C-type lectin lectoxin-Lio3-like n=1 Tax=Branchiostoma lanceolatum TaxID=7740 RepID=UPI003453003E